MHHTSRSSVRESDLDPPLDPRPYPSIIILMTICSLRASYAQRDVGAVSRICVGRIGPHRSNATAPTSLEITWGHRSANLGAPADLRRSANSARSAAETGLRLGRSGSLWRRVRSYAMPVAATTSAASAPPPASRWSRPRARRQDDSRRWGAKVAPGDDVRVGDGGGDGAVSGRGAWAAGRWRPWRSRSTGPASASSSWSSRRRRLSPRRRSESLSIERVERTRHRPSRGRLSPLISSHPTNAQ